MDPELGVNQLADELIEKTHEKSESSRNFLDTDVMSCMCIFLFLLDYKQFFLDFQLYLSFSDMKLVVTIPIATTSLEHDWFIRSAAASKPENKNYSMVI